MTCEHSHTATEQLPTRESTEQYLSVREAAEMLRITERSVQLLVKRRAIEYKSTVRPDGRGNGIIYLIPLSAINERIAKRIGICDSATPVVLTPEVACPTTAQRYGLKYVPLISAAVRATKVERARIIKEWNATHPDHALSQARFKQLIKNWIDAGGPSGLLSNYGKTRGRSLAFEKLDAWGNAHGIGDLGALCYERFAGFYLRSQSLDADECCRKVRNTVLALVPADSRLEFERRFPSTSTFLRRLRQQYNAAELSLARDGKSSYERTHETYIDRDYSSLPVNQIWVGDHHRLDVSVFTPDGNTDRPWLTAWCDARTGRFVAWEIRAAAPASDVIMTTLGDGCIEHGKPAEVLTDNGKDYLAKAFSDESNLSMLSMLGIGVRRALPFRGQSKIIERMFGDVCSQFAKWYPTYTGNKPSTRPDSWDAAIKRKDIPLLGDVKKAFADFIAEYNSRISKQGIKTVPKGWSRERAFRELPSIEKVLVTEETINRVICRNTRPLTVRRGRLRYENAHWTGGVLHALEGRSVMLKLPLRDPNVAYVVDPTTNQVLGIVEPAIKIDAFADSQEQRDLLAIAMQERTRLNRQRRDKIKAGRAIGLDDVRTFADRFLAKANAIRRGKVDSSNTLEMLIGVASESHYSALTQECIVGAGEQITPEIATRLVEENVIKRAALAPDGQTVVLMTPLDVAHNEAKAARATGTYGMAHLPAYDPDLDNRSVKKIDTLLPYRQK